MFRFRISTPPRTTRPPLFHPLQRRLPRGSDLSKRQRHSTIWSSNHPARWRYLLPKYIACPVPLSTYALLPVHNRLRPSRPQPGSRGQAGTTPKFEGEDLDSRESVYITSQFFRGYDIGNSAVLPCVRCTIITSFGAARCPSPKAPGEDIPSLELHICERRPRAKISRGTIEWYIHIC